MCKSDFSWHSGNIPKYLTAFTGWTEKISCLFYLNLQWVICIQPLSNYSDFGFGFSFVLYKLSSSKEIAVSSANAMTSPLQHTENKSFIYVLKDYVSSPERWGTPYPMILSPLGYIVRFDNLRSAVQVEFRKL